MRNDAKQYSPLHFNRRSYLTAAVAGSALIPSLGTAQHERDWSG